MEQMTLWDMTRPPIKIDKPIRLIEIFSGYGSQFMAMKRLGADVTSWLAVDIDKYAIASYNAVHGTNYEPMDVSQIRGGTLNLIECDKYDYLLFYSFPCLVGESMVITKDGFKEIKDISVGDQVLSHDNQYHKVLASRKTGRKKLYSIKGMSIDEVRCTGNHKFYVRKMVRHYPTYENGKRGSVRTFLPPEYIECEKLDKSYYMGIAINTESIIPKWDGVTFLWSDNRKGRTKNELQKYMGNKDFWWLIGRYLGDGWIRTQGGIIICAACSETEDITRVADRLDISYSVAHERTVDKIHFAHKELEEFVKPFGRGAENKNIPGFVFDLPKKLLKAFVDGYVSADGSYTQGKFKTSSVSRKLSYGIGQCVAKAYSVPFAIYKCRRKEQSVIEGRVINQKVSWSVVWKKEKKKQDKAFFEDGYIWFPITSVEQTEDVEDVYDIEVEDAHSFTANGVITHNCTDLSLAGKQAGMDRDSGTRSGLLWEVERILKECYELSQNDRRYGMPKVLVMENVTEVHGYKNKANFDEWVTFLESMGYSNYMQDLNAAEYGVAQHRERCFMVSLLGNYNYKFPTPIPLNKVMADYLEDEVDDKFYVKSQKAYDLIIKLLDNGTLPSDNALASKQASKQASKIR